MMVSGFRSARGFVLITMLCCVVIITVIVVVFLSSMTTESKISKASADAGSLKPLADTCANVVISQIQAATKEAAENSFAWASQPGMIRVFNNTDGKLVDAYKLYSSDHMVVQEVNPTTELAALADWNKKPALFTDLNAPRGGVYPIMDVSAANGTNAVAGFSVGTPPGSSTNAAAMPGQWLYVLQDGTLVAPVAGANDTTAAISGATDENPIVGRIAFWTDDETCKVNINTAGEGTYWDIPRFAGASENDLVRFQPAQKEYQRYPGHPAMVSMSAVLPSLTRDQIYKLIPRIVSGGSDGATKAATRTPLSPDSDRLYASVDEFIFANDRNANIVDKNTLAARRFFLTTSSRAPELNLFGMPRVSVWPVHSDLALHPESLYTTPYDRIAAFCSTFGGSASPKRYYIQRQNADHPLEDYDRIPRNQELFGYLGKLTETNVPGFGGSFQGKYEDSRNQILTEIYDYIRCVNLLDENLTSPIYRMPDSPPNQPVLPPRAVMKDPPIYQYTAPLFLDGNQLCAWPGSGQVAPIKISKEGTALKGFGRFYSISEVAVQMICCADGDGLDPDAIGAAHDPRTISNLTEKRLLKDSSGTLVDRTYSGTTNYFPRNAALGDTYSSAGLVTALKPGEKRVQAALLIETFTPSQGSAFLSPEMKISVEGLENIEIGGIRPFPTSANGVLVHRVDNAQKDWLLLGGVGVFKALGTHVKYWTNDSVGSFSGWAAKYSSHYRTYLWVSRPFTVPSATQTMSFGGNPTQDLVIKTYVGPTTLAAAFDDKAISPDLLVQTCKIRFPSATVPIPDLMQFSMGGVYVEDWWEFEKRLGYAEGASGYDGGKVAQQSGCVVRVDPNANTTGNSEWRLDEARDKAWDLTKGWSSRSDVVRSMVPKAGDSRLIAGLNEVPAGLWEAHPDYQKSGVKLAHSLSGGMASDITPGMADKKNGMSPVGKIIAGADYPSKLLPDIPPGVTAAEETGDWDNGYAWSVDGPYINKPDDGSILYSTAEHTLANFKLRPLTGTPNRIMPSAGMFGSLPTGINPKTPGESIPWQTLLFRPQPSHPQSKQSRPDQPPDHLVMDLFTMPVVEPYAISEPFSTAGKVNMNYQIMPYSYIHRSTALQAAFKSEKLVAVPTGAGQDYKTNAAFSSVRFDLNLDPTDSGSTLRQFQAKFAAGDIFRSATEICDIFLVPKGKSWNSDAEATAYWGTMKLTGDNARERPYTNLYAKLTTRSNSYQVYYCVQSLKKVKGTPADQWSETRDKVTAEQRGAYLLERYLNPNDATLPDAANDVAASRTPKSLDGRYQFRIVSRKVMDL